MDDESNATLPIPPLRAVAYVKTHPSWAGQFPLFDITLITKPFTALASDQPFDAAVQVVLLDLDGMSVSDEVLVQSLVRSRGCAGVGLTDAADYHGLLSLAAGLDAVGPATASASGIAWLIRSAYVQCHEKRRFSQQLAELEEKMRQKELIARAKAIMAEHGKTTESEALRQLRNESRKQRRAMWELAQLIIDAHTIMCPKPHPRQSAKEPWPLQRGVVSAGSEEIEQFDRL